MSSEKTRKLDTLAKLFEAMRYRTRRNQLGTPRGGEEFSEMVQIFPTMPNNFKLCPTHFWDAHSVILNKPRLHTKEPLFVQKKQSLCYEQKHMSVLI